MSNYSIISTLIGSLVISCGTTAFASPYQTSNTFVFDMLQRNRAQMQLAQLAYRRSASPSIRTLASQIMANGEYANAQLEQLAYEQGGATPGMLSVRENAILDGLSIQRGNAFDQAFTRDIAQSSRSTIADLKTETSSTDDPSLLSFANRMIPLTRDDLRLARQDAGESVG